MSALRSAKTAMHFCNTCGRRLEADAVCASCTKPRQDPMIGQTMGGYEVQARLGGGGMGAVYRATPVDGGPPVALKVIRNETRDLTSAIKRFYREAQLQSSLSHPNIVSIVDFGNTADGQMYLAMELVEGRSLDAFIPPRGLPPVVVVEVFSAICAGVGAAHAAGIVHRDLKPANVVIAANDDARASGGWTVKVLDFGLSKSQGNTRLTRTGQVIGTPGYCAPELIGNSDEADARADIYSLGALLYYMLTGAHLYNGPNAQAILARQCMDAPNLTALGRDAPRRALRPLVERMLHADPDQRPQTVDDVMRAFDTALGRRP